MWRVLAVGVVTVLLVATAYESAIALGAISIGRLPGEGATGEGFALAAALLAMLGGIVVAAAAAGRIDARFRVLIAPAGVVFVAARFYTYDPYHAPTLRRMSEGGAVIGRWIVLLLATAAAAAVLSWLRPSIGGALTGLALVLDAMTTLFEAAGH